MIPDWPTYHAHMLRAARQAKSARVKSIWLNGAARARAEMQKAKTPAQGRLAL